MADLSTLASAGRTVAHVVGRAVVAVGPFVLGAFSIVPFCAGGVLMLNVCVATYGPLVALRAAAIAAEAVVIIPAHVGLGCWLCSRITAATHTKSSSPARHRRVA
jgi:hypothetical protein